MAIANPYAADLGDREPIAAMRDATERMQTLMGRWNADAFERSYAPGKWTARQILVHLAQTEIALGNRARMALTIPNYTSQPFDQDRWMDIEGAGGAGKAGGAGGSGGVTGSDALAAVVAMNAVNRALFSALSPSQRSTPFTHPEYGALTVDWLIHQMAGHLCHHLVQFEIIAKQ